MDGGCIDVWLKDATSDKDRELLQGYARYIDHMGGSFSICHKAPRIDSKFEEGKILKAIGYIPKEEIVICGFADFIFQATEEMLSQFEGYLHCGIPDEDFARFQSKEFRIKVYKSGDPRYSDYCLLTRSTVSKYFNWPNDKTIRDICSLNRFFGKDLTFSN
jgi:hypothetical protein